MFAKVVIFLRKTNKSFNFYVEYRKHLPFPNQKKSYPLHSNTIILYTFAAEVFVAQLVEQLTLNQWVRGSSPREDTKEFFFRQSNVERSGLFNVFALRLLLFAGLLQLICS